MICLFVVPVCLSATTISLHATHENDVFNLGSYFLLIPFRPASEIPLLGCNVDSVANSIVWSTCYLQFIGTILVIPSFITLPSAFLFQVCSLMSLLCIFLCLQTRTVYLKSNAPSRLSIACMRNALTLRPHMLQYLVPRDRAPISGGQKTSCSHVARGIRWKRKFQQWTALSWMQISAMRLIASFMATPFRYLPLNHFTRPKH